MTVFQKYFLLALVFITYVIYTQLFSQQKTVSSNIVKIKRNIFLCTSEAAKIYYNSPKLFYEQYQNCLKTNVPIFHAKMDEFENEFYDKRILFPLSKKYRQEKCKWLTIGIGGSIKAEAAFHKKYPECKIYGVEPIAFGNFSKIGTVIPFGVGLEETEIELKVMVDKKSNSYEMQKTKVISLTNLLDNYIGSRFLQYLTMDVEGYEYNILRELLQNGKFVNDGITFCQIDVEYHEPLFQNSNLSRFFLDFLDDSSEYIPLRSSGYTNFYINYKNAECESAFNFSSYFM